MRGGRNKFGPMYKRDRARKLQILRQRQIALQAIRGQINGPNVGGVNLLDASQSQLSPTGSSVYPTQSHPQAQSYNSMHIKQEIQIPQVRRAREVIIQTVILIAALIICRSHRLRPRRTRRPVPLRSLWARWARPTGVEVTAAARTCQLEVWMGRTVWW